MCSSFIIDAMHLLRANVFNCLGKFASPAEAHILIHKTLMCVSCSMNHSEMTKVRKHALMSFKKETVPSGGTGDSVLFRKERKIFITTPSFISQLQYHTNDAWVNRSACILYPLFKGFYSVWRLLTTTKWTLSLHEGRSEKAANSSLTHRHRGYSRTRNKS